MTSRLTLSAFMLISFSCINLASKTTLNIDIFIFLVATNVTITRPAVEPQAAMEAARTTLTFGLHRAAAVEAPIWVAAVAQ